MKKLPVGGSFMRGMAAGLAVFACVSVARAIPFASGITNIGTGGANVIQFVMNEGGATVNVVFGDGTTNAMGVLPAGKTNFTLPGTNLTYQIITFKGGTGVPAQITTDTNQFNIWNSPRGIDTIKNPKIGWLFGRMIIGSAAAGVNGLGAYTTKGIGLYAINADCSDSYLGKGTNASYTSFFTGSTGPGTIQSSPHLISVNQGDYSVDITDNSPSLSSVYKLDPNFQNTPITLLGPVGQTAGETAGTHSEIGDAFTTGSTNTGDLVLFTSDPDLACPASVTTLGTGGNGPTTHGGFNNLYRYDIGSGPLPWTNGPVFAVNLDLPGFQIDSPVFCENGADPTKVYGGADRANLSDGNLQVFDRTTGQILYTSLNPVTGADAFADGQGVYNGLRVSPDGNFVATETIDNIIIVANLTNGIPDESSIVTIADTSSVGNARGLAFDAADNIYEVSSGQGLMRGFSLGITGTTISSNDYTCTNGSFSLVLPAATASVVASTPLASQNYTNNAVNPGAPIPGVFTISLNTNNLIGNVAVQMALSGTAVLGSNYTINTTDANGVTFASNLVTFPAGPHPGGGNWTANLIITPTKSPVSGPTLTVGIKLSGGLNYQAVAPVTGTISIANTGPQVLFVSAVAKGASMNRGIAGDYAEYTLTRWGDTNGPNNSSISISASSYTVTNFDYLGTAVFPTDYTAQSQNFVAGTPVDGTPGITVNPGATAITALVGNPVRHTNLALNPTNKTIIIALTNAATGTNLTSAQNTPYQVTTASVTLTEVDNTVGQEVVIWSDPLTNNLDNTWTLTYGNTNRGSNPVLPVVIPSYTNGQSELATGGTNDFVVTFGNSVASDSIPPSPIMTASNWTTALKMTVNKNTAAGSASGVNLYPQGQNFVGNVALRFSMYLSLYDFAIGNSSQTGREFALFGIDHFGTNNNWRPTGTVTPGTGAGPTNWDGIWFAIDAGTSSLTPADYDAFSSPSLPNNNGTPDTDVVSTPTATETGVFKNPPFTTDSGAAGGNPANQWVDVDVEKWQTNNLVNASAFNVFGISTFIDRSQVLASFLTTNNISTANYTNGTIMLGYEDPLADVSDQNAYVYFSNVRVVELAPYLTVPPRNLLVFSGTNLTFTNIATFATIPGMTNTWSTGVGGPINLLQTDTTNGSTIVSTLTANNVTKGTNYVAVASDAAGPITNVNVVEVIANPANVTVAAGAKATFTVPASGQGAPTFQWSTNGINLANGAKYTNVTTASLGISNSAPADTTVTYVCTVTTAGGTLVTTGATLTIATAPSAAVVAPASTNALWGSSVTFTVTAAGTAPFTYQWKKAGVNISGATTSAFTIPSVTGITNSVSYTAGVTNAAGGTVSSAGVLTVTEPQPSISAAVSLSGGNVALSFTSANGSDTTSAFILQSSPVATGPYTNTPGTVTTTGGGNFQVTSPQTSSTSMFYRLLHAN